MCAGYLPFRAGVHGARMTYPVRPVYTASDTMHPATLTAQKVASKTAAVRLCRALGYRVLTAGGIVELSVDSIDTDGAEHMAWAVTVHYPAKR